MNEGTVKWFDVKKGFGFLTGPEGQDVFIHFSSIDGDGFRTLKDGELVRYELHSGDKGDFAKHVQRFTKEEPDDGDRFIGEHIHADDAEGGRPMAAQQAAQSLAE